MRKFNEYDFVKFNFIKDCLLFGKKERFFIVLGVCTWLFLVLFFLVFAGVLTLALKLI
jgi:hypothetical protein